MDIDILEKIGLTKTEVKLYVALLKLGESSTTKIMQESQVPASKVYEFLDKLIKKGIVSYILRNGKKYFKAEDPNNIKTYLDTKKENIDKQIDEVNKIIPHLSSLKSSKEEEIGAAVYEGINGVKSIYEMTMKMLGRGEIHYIIGAPKIGNELLEGYLLDWHKRRIKKGIKCRYIYDENAREYGKVRKDMPLTDVRYLSAEIISPVWTEIAKDYVITGHIAGKNIIVFAMKDKEMAKKYINYFDMIWKTCKK